MNNIIVHVYYTCKPGMADAFVKALKESGAQAKVHAEDGCIQYDYFLSYEAADTVVLLEKWRDADALSVHMQQPHMADIRAITAEYTVETRGERYECV